MLRLGPNVKQTPNLSCNFKDFIFEKFVNSKSELDTYVTFKWDKVEK